MSGPDPAAAPLAGLPGWAEDDVRAAFQVFRRHADGVRSGRPSLRPAQSVRPDLRALFEEALALPPDASAGDAAQFFTDRFVPHPLPEAFLTGYYEPVVAGARAPGPDFTAPLVARPADLKTFAEGETRPPWASQLSAARVEPDGTLGPYPDRAAIEGRIGRAPFRPIVWLRDWVEVFLIQVQGSARVRLPDGETLRLTYAGRNGHPYTSVGRLVVDASGLDPAAMSLERLKAWLRAAGQQPGQAGRTLMQRNASYIFFTAEPDRTGGGPIGGAGGPLTPLRSIAVDRSRWCYGLPFWIDATLPWRSPTPEPFRRLMIAEDTGSAIVGDSRVDLFFGSGPDAGRQAGGIRHHGSLTVLLPRSRAP